MTNYHVGERVDAIDGILGRPDLGVRWVNIARHIVWWHKQLLGESIARIETHRPQTAPARFWRWVFGD